jgi:mono/diheme cytochrome c family protein
VLLRWLIRIALIGVAVVALIQLVPYGRDHTNPPVRKEPAWAGAQTRRLAADACFDCHSNLTTWPWYSNVAPVSWLVYRDVKDGRAELNFSEWNLPQDGAGDAAEAVRSGSMPPWQYKLLHPKSRLSAAERDALAAGLAATVSASPPPGGGG